MESRKIVAALIEHTGKAMTAAELADLSFAKINTVQTFLRRHKNAFTASSETPRGGRGQPAKRYRLKDAWVPVLRSKWYLDDTEPAEGPLSASLEILDRASFAVIDPNEAMDDRLAMVDLATARIAMIRDLLFLADAQAQDEALLSIRKAEVRIAEFRAGQGASGSTPAQTESMCLGSVVWADETEPVLESLRRAWFTRVEHMVKKYDVTQTFSHDENNGVALVVDLIPEANDPLQEHLLDTLSAQGKAFACFSIADMSATKRDGFMAEFETLALDPVAAAQIYVTMDSRRDQCIGNWKRINRLGSRQHALRAVQIATDSLTQALAEMAQALVSQQIASAYYLDVIKKITQSPHDGKTLWPIYGSPNVLDVVQDEAFKKTAENNYWHYTPNAISAEMRSLDTE